MAHRLLIVSNRLPISVEQDGDTLSLQRSSGGLATALASLFRPKTALWIGWSGIRRHLSDDEVRGLHIPSHLALVNLTPEEISHYYDCFSNGTLWPLFHGLPATATCDADVWRDYKTVTQKFADAVEASLRSTDTLWIHDYHLMLLPAELRRRGITNRIGFFLHTPFPKASMVASIPHAAELFKSLLSVDVLGLQTQRDTRRCKQVYRSLDLQPSQTTVKTFPIGVDFESFDNLRDKVNVKEMAKKFKKQMGAPTVILSISRLDYTKGILTQLHAFKKLLGILPTGTKVAYRLNVAPSRELVPEYQELRIDIEQLVDRINTEYGTASWQPVVYSYENIGPAELAAWYQIADIHLNTPVADGMNLVAKEYVAARHSPGVLVISDTMGAADQLTDALIVPPDDITATADALKHALEMPTAEKARRWKALRHTVQTSPVEAWAESFLDELDPKNKIK